MKKSIVVGATLAVALATGTSVFAAAKSPTAVHRAHPRHHLVSRFKLQIVKDIRGALSLSPHELRQDLRKGQSMIGIAEAHGVSLAKLTSSVEADLKTALNQRVAKGQMTVTKSQRIEKAVSRHLVTWLKKPNKFWMRRPRRFRWVAASSRVLGLKPRALMKDLRQGQSIAAVAQQHGMTEASLQSALYNRLQAHLNKRVTAGKLSNTREQKILTAFNAHASHWLSFTWTKQGKHHK